MVMAKGVKRSSCGTTTMRWRTELFPPQLRLAVTSRKAHREMNNTPKPSFAQWAWKANIVNSFLQLGRTTAVRQSRSLKRPSSRHVLAILGEYWVRPLWHNLWSVGMTARIEPLVLSRLLYVCLRTDRVATHEKNAYAQILSDVAVEIHCYQSLPCPLLWFAPLS